MSSPDAYYEAKSDRAEAFAAYKASDQYAIDLRFAAITQLVTNEDFRDDVLTEVMIYDMTKLPQLLIDDPAEFGRVAKIHALDRAMSAVAVDVAHQWDLDYDSQ